MEKFFNKIFNRNQPQQEKQMPAVPEGAVRKEYAKINMKELNASMDKGVRGFTLFMNQALPVINDFIAEHPNLKLEGNFDKPNPEESTEAQFDKSKAFYRIVKDQEEIGRIAADPLNIYINIGGIVDVRKSENLISDDVPISETTPQYLKTLLNMPAVKKIIES